ncbi:tRNA lysidine(34) synthetase TilS [bacterium]|nr:tRNA lysidine(34) synthetase TilS [bacterium]
MSAPSPTAWDNLNHQVWKNIKECGLEQKDSFVLCISGGLDSMVLLDVFLKVKPTSRIKVVHYHHGISAHTELQKFRDSNVQLIREICMNSGRNVEFLTAKSSEELRSEEQFRNARWNFIRSIKQESDVVVTAHHLDDRFETILLKMIRGTSSEGLTSFKMWNGEILRPLLDQAKSELMLYAKKHNLDWNEDPSNSDDSYLRNWLRQVWLAKLDEKVNGGSQNFAKSLFKIADLVLETQTFELIMEPNSESLALSRQWYVSLSKQDQLRALALFLKKHHILSFTTGHLEEIGKRLDKNQKDITFEILGRKWVINASQIMLQ